MGGLPPSPNLATGLTHPPNLAASPAVLSWVTSSPLHPAPAAGVRPAGRPHGSRSDMGVGTAPHERPAPPLHRGLRPSQARPPPGRGLRPAGPPAHGGAGPGGRREEQGPAARGPAGAAAQRRTGVEWGGRRRFSFNSAAGRRPKTRGTIRLMPPVCLRYGHLLHPLCMASGETNSSPRRA